MSSESTATSRWFPVTSGRASGVIGLVAGAVIVLLALLESPSLTYVLVGLLVGLLSWLVLLRPRVGVRGTDLLLRGMVSTTVIPLASIGAVTLRQVLAIRVAGKRYVSPAVGHTFRYLNRQRRGGVGEENQPIVDTGRAADHVLALIESHIDEARREGAPADEVRREWGWLELGALGLLVVAILVSALV